MIYFSIYLILCLGAYIVFNNISIKSRILGFWEIKSKRIDKKAVLLICLLVFLIFSWIFYGLLERISPAAALGMLPAVAIYSMADLAGRYMEDREIKQITFFLMTMAKWSGIKNDLVYCLRKTDEINMKNPLGKMVRTTLGRIYSGMDTVSAMELLEEETYGEDMRYLVKNIRFSAEKGGNLQKLFTGMEQQYFKIDEEYFKRRISTLRDRAAVYITIIMVVAAGIWFIGGNPVARQFYMDTLFGNLLLGLFSLVFVLAIVFVLRK